jgi:hypothetical protein
MTKFDKTKILSFSGNISYDGKFVARCRRVQDSKGFVSFLVKNFTVEEYFGLLEAMPPSKVLATKGYVSLTVKQILKRFGYTQDQEGFKKYIAEDMARQFSMCV